jgi:phosphohistidine phosphatase
MKRLLLLRHAKASQDPAPSDHMRPLAPRGRKDAPEVAKAMGKAGFVPELVLSSGSKRTRETWELMADALKAEPRVEFTDALYLAPPKAMLNVAREADDRASTLMILGHNPGMEELAAALLRPEAEEEERAHRALLREKFPTGALAVIDCRINHWHELVPGVGQLRAFMRPKDLG